MKPNVIEVREESLQMSVIERSYQYPILLYMETSWSNPCRALTPILEQLAAESGGAWLLAKADVTEDHAIAAKYGVMAVPTTKLFVEGQVVDGFMGVLPKTAVRAFLEKWIAPQEEKQVAGAEEESVQGQQQEVPTALTSILGKGQENEQAVPALDSLEIEGSSSDAARPDIVPSSGANGSVAEQSSSKEASEEGRVREDVDTDSMDARFERARAAAAEGDYDGAAQGLISIIEEDRSFRDGAAHKAMLDLFALMGDDERTERYRQQLSWLLFP